MPFRKLTSAGLVAAIFVLSAGLIAYAWWLFQIERGNRAARAGDMEAASEIYETAEALPRKIPFAVYLLKEDYPRLLFNQIGVLYAQARDDEVSARLDEAARSAPYLAESAEYSFWTGNLLLRRASEAATPKELVNTLKAALYEYEKGLAADPDHWDLKYNYELLKQILTQKDRDAKPEERVKSILDRMRPTVDPKRDHIPREKRG